MLGCGFVVIVERFLTRLLGSPSETISHGSSLSKGSLAKGSVKLECVCVENIQGIK
jgi:hypothetical protein